jgi:hypothetical protein
LVVPLYGRAPAIPDLNTLTALARSLARSAHQKMKWSSISFFEARSI